MFLHQVTLKYAFEIEKFDESVSFFFEYKKLQFYKIE